MSDVVDIDPSLRALDTLADDFADPGDETAGCASMWPLLAVPSDALSPLDRDARDRHLARCARCRVAMTDAWLDVDADGAALAPVKAVVPAATALPTLPERRRRGMKLLAGLSVAAAAAASLFAIVLPMMHSSAPDHSVAQRDVPVTVDARPLELVFVVEDGARTSEALPAVNAALARLRDHVPSGTRVTITSAHREVLDVLARDRAPTDDLTIGPITYADSAGPPAYNEVLGDADALFRDPSHRRAIVIIGAACGDFSAEQSVDSVRANGVTVVAAELEALPCHSIVRGAFIARNSFDIVASIGAAVDAAARAAGDPPDVEHRAPLDLLILIDGHYSFMGSDTDEDDPLHKRSAYEAVRTTLDQIDPHIPEHSVIRIATMTGDTVTVLGRGEYPYIPLARSIIGEPASYDQNPNLPRYSVVLERARHLLEARHDRTPALLIIGNTCVDDNSTDLDTIRREFRTLRAEGVKIAIVHHLTAMPPRHECMELVDGNPADHYDTDDRFAIPGLVFDAVEDLSRPTDAPPRPTELLHFVHDTLSAP